MAVNRESSLKGNNPRGPVQVADCHVQLPSTQFSQRMVREFHRKVSSFVQCGQRMRFCQSCLRVQRLDLFDDDKRRAVSATVMLACRSRSSATLLTTSLICSV